jgi:hypothetical protein
LFLSSWSLGPTRDDDDDDDDVGVEDNDGSGKKVPVYGKKGDEVDAGYGKKVDGKKGGSGKKGGFTLAWAPAPTPEPTPSPTSAPTQSPTPAPTPAQHLLFHQSQRCHVNCFLSLHV